MVVFITHAQSSELDWTQVNWNSGNTSQTFNDVDGSGIDITISLTINGGFYYSPLDDSNSSSSLVIFPDFSTDNPSTSFIDVNISFSSTVYSADFSLLDVDRGRSGNISYWEDIIEDIQASNEGNTTDDLTITAGSEIRTVTNSGETEYRGRSNQNWNDASTLQIAWAAPVDNISFRYSSGSRAISNPVAQVIGLSNITFTPVPEPGAYVTGLCALALLGWREYKKRKSKKKFIKF